MEDTLKTVCQSATNKKYYLVKTSKEPVEKDGFLRYETYVYNCDAEGNIIGENPVDYNYSHSPDSIHVMHGKMCIQIRR